MNIFQIENEYLKVSVHETGAELCSVYNKIKDIEHIWQAQPDIWSSHAPNLFPVIGAIKDGFKIIDGKKYKVPRHGFIRNNEKLRLKERTDRQLVFELLHDKETLKVYPYQFSFRIAFTLRENKLEISHEIINLDQKPIYFSLGGHPAFNICLSENEKISDYSLRFDQKMNLDTLLLNEKGLVTKKSRSVLRSENEFRLSEDIFNNDALIFRNIPAKRISLRSRERGEILNVSYKDFKNLGIWSKPGAPYVCIEPWLGIADFEDAPDDFTRKADVLSIEAEKEFYATYEIEFSM